MDERTLPFAAEIETLKEIYAAINRNDVPAFLAAFDPEIEWTEFAGSPNGGTYRGHAALGALLSKGRGSWAEGTCEPQRFIVAGDKIVVFDYVRVRLKGQTEWLEGPLGAVYTFRNGKAIQARIFSERKDALAWAGIEALDTI